METNENLYTEAVNLLCKLIETPSVSKEEHHTAEILKHFFNSNNIPHNAHLNNIWVKNKHFNDTTKTILLNSHHDTVKPNKSYTLYPFKAIKKDGKLFGLGSNDAGGCLVSLLAAFLYFYESDNLKYNLIFAASAEEEISGRNGIESLLPLMGTIDFGIVGEPTLTNLAIAEKGLLVIDCLSKGIAGHAAREEGENALYKAITDINWFKNYQFEKVSNLLGPVKMTVTSIETTNKAHNVIPDTCHFTVDIRVNENYTFNEILKTISKNISSEITPRSLRLQSSSIPLTHPIIQSGVKLGKKTYGSPTTSDKALMPFPTLKMGPGDSARSHTADEFIYLSEIKDGINSYIEILKNIL